MSPNKVQRQSVQRQHSDTHQSTSTNVRLHSARIDGTTGGPDIHLGLQVNSAKNQHTSQSTHRLPNFFPQSHLHTSRKVGPKGNSSMQLNTTGHSHAPPIVSFDEKQQILGEQAEPALMVVTWPEHFDRFPILAQPNLSSRQPWSPKKLSITRESWSPIIEEPTSSTEEPLDRTNPWSISKISFTKDPWVLAQPSSQTSNPKKHPPVQETFKNKKRQVGRYG